MTRTSFLFCLLFVLFSARAYAQPAIEWQHAYGGSKTDCAYSVLQTYEGGYIVLGHSGSINGDATANNGKLDFWVTKLDAKGNLEWQHSYGGSEIEEAYSIYQCIDSGYVLAGYTESNDGDVTGNHGSKDCWIVRIDKVGNVLWKKTLGGSGVEECYSSITQTGDLGFIFAVSSSSRDGDLTSNKGEIDSWVIKLDKDGNIQWQHSYGGSQYDKPYDIKPTSDGGYILAGYTGSTDGDITKNNGRGDGWIVKLDAMGNKQWQNAYGGSEYDGFYSIEETSDGAYIAAGFSTSHDNGITVHNNNNSPDFWVVKLAKDGTLLWQRTFGGDDGDFAERIHETKDKGYILSGHTFSSNGDVTGFHDYYDAWVVKLSNDGAMEWQQAFGGKELDDAYDIKETNDGGYIFTGSTYSSDGDVSVAPGFHDPNNASDFWVVKLAPPSGRPHVLGFESVPTILQCDSKIDSVHVLLPYRRTYQISSLEITGVDKDNFTCPAAFPMNMTSSDMVNIGIPILFSPVIGIDNKLYNAAVSIITHNVITNVDDTLALPISGYAMTNVALTFTARFTNASAKAGDLVWLPLEWQLDSKNFPVPVETLNITGLEFTFEYNTDILDIIYNDLRYAFEPLINGWGIDITRSEIDNVGHRLTLFLTGTTPLPGSSSAIGTLIFMATLNDKDTATSFRIRSCKIFTVRGQEMEAPCITATTVSDTNFTIEPQCGDNFIRGMLRGEELKPFSISIAHPNPVSSGTVSFVCKSNVAGELSGSLFDERGSEVRKVVTKQILAKGQYSLTFDVHDLRSGVYYYRFNLNGYASTGSFVVAR